MFISQIFAYGFSISDFSFDEELSESQVETVYYSIYYKKVPEWKFFLPASYKKYTVMAEPWLNLQGTYEETNSFDEVIVFFGQWLTAISNEDVPDLFNQAVLLSKEFVVDLEGKFIIDFAEESNFSVSEKKNYEILLNDLIRRIEALEIEQGSSNELINQLKNTQDLVEKGATKKQIKQTLIGTVITEGAKQVINASNLKKIFHIVGSAIQEHLPKLLN